MVFSRICLLAMCVAWVLYIPAATADTDKASDWIGRVVVTVDGELLGRIEDFALNVEQRRIEFVVVSIGSFLVDNNLIAIHPDALGESDDGRYLVVYADTLDSAQRFGPNSWPSGADVLVSTDRQPVVVEDLEISAENEDSSLNRIATISDGRRTATLNAGERNARIETTAAPPVRASSEVQPKRFKDAGSTGSLLADSEFERLDDNGDGYLSRSEIGDRLKRDVRYQDYDLDGNDGIDTFEYQILKERG